MIETIELDSVDSTNDEAKRRLADGSLTKPTRIIAFEQTAGRGTRGRSWQSPSRAGVYLTYVDPIGPWPAASSYTLAAGVACAEAIASECDLRVELRGVNDLVVNDRKLGGILTESIARGRMLDVLIVGIGINLGMAPREVRDGGLAPISLAEVAGIVPSIRDLSDGITRRLETWLRRAVDDDAAVREAHASWSG